MRTIHKFTHPVAERFTLQVPFYAKFLHVDRDTRQPDDLAFWFEVNTEAPMQDRKFIVVGTGHPVPNDAINHVGSVKMGAFIWHIYGATT